MRRVLFYRHFDVFWGGHLKVWDYFNHVLSSRDHDAWVQFSRRSTWDDSNPWRASLSRVVPPRVKFDADLLFLDGVDWLNVKRRERRRPRRPVINLVQHVRHADPDNIRYSFLPHRAIRICVSPEVAAAVSATGRVNGPIFTIPNGLDLDDLPRCEHVDRDIDLLVVANKRPQVGMSLYNLLRRPGREVQLVSTLLARPEFLSRLRRSRVTLFVPNLTEGFYLPALEGMALGTLVVCPDCVGNRSFCLPNANCLRPHYEESSMLEAAEAALQMPSNQVGRLLKGARTTAEEHDLMTERRMFLDILSAVEQLWES